MGPKEDRDSRKSLRTPVELQVEYCRINAFLSDYTENISAGGTFIATPRPLDIGTEFHFQLIVPGVPAPVRLRGVVVRVVEASAESIDQSERVGMAIRFLYETKAEALAMRRLVERLIVKHLGPRASATLLRTLKADAESDIDGGLSYE